MSEPANDPQDRPAETQRLALLDEATRGLGRMAGLERGMKGRPASDPEAVAMLNEARLGLARRIQEAREAGRQPGEEAVAGPFTRTLGPVAGAVAEGEEVRRLQRLLAAEGFAVAATGRYDSATVVAVRGLQEKHGLRARDGLVNAETRLLLNRLLDTPPASDRMSPS